MSEDDFDVYVVNTSNLGFHMILNSKENIVILGNPIYKLINSRDNTFIKKFITIYANYCIDDDSELAIKITEYITCRSKS